jgi:serine/threonine protein kinase
VAAEPGTKLGRYEIRSKVGTSGMGEVYPAEDTRLRKVALKILPTELAANKDRMRRFEQEHKLPLLSIIRTLRTPTRLARAAESTS